MRHRHSRRDDSREDYPLDPVLDFLRLLWAIEHRLQRRSKAMEASLGITGPQRLVLRIVGRFPGLSAGELAHIVQLHKSTISGVLQRLITRGLLVREKDPEDNRRIRLRLKPRAQKFTRNSAGTVERTVAQVLSRVARHEMRVAREVLSALAAALDVTHEQTAGRRAPG